MSSFRLSIPSLLLFIWIGTQLFCAVSSHPSKRAGTTLNVNINSNKGTPSYLASGILYGLPNSVSLGSPTPSLPGWLYNNIKLRFVRAGGAQSPLRGYGANQNGGEEGYRQRWASTLEYWKTFKSRAPSNGRFVLLPHDLWGADSTTLDLRWPCDNGNCSEYETFLNLLISDMKANGLTNGVDIDIWNEPNNQPFWDRSQAQYLQMWNTAYRIYRDAFPDHNAVRLIGPSTVSQPEEGDNWWNAFLQEVSTQNTVPDVYSWHLLFSSGGCGNDPVFSQSELKKLLQKYNLPTTNAQQVNEWGESNNNPPQEPNFSAWQISRFERTGIEALRGNYGFGVELHDNLAGLISNRTGFKYYPLSEWQVHTAYTNMTGIILQTSSTNECVDLFATKDTSKKSLTILIGAKGDQQAGSSVAISFANTKSFSDVFGSGKVSVRVDNFALDGNNPAYKPSSSTTQVVSVTGNTFTYPLKYQTLTSAYRITLTRG